MEQRFVLALDRYANERIPTGSFLRAVLENDLKEAFIRADEEATRDMKEIVMYCYWKIPFNCWGSKEAVAQWLECDEKVGGESPQTPML